MRENMDQKSSNTDTFHAMPCLYSYLKMSPISFSLQLYFINSVLHVLLMFDRMNISFHVCTDTAQKLKFPIEDFTLINFPTDLFTFTKEILKGKLRFLCTEILPCHVYQSGKLYCFPFNPF